MTEHKIRWPTDEEIRRSMLEGARWNGERDKREGSPLSMSAYDYNREARAEYVRAYKEASR